MKKIISITDKGLEINEDLLFLSISYIGCFVATFHYMRLGGII